MAIEADMKIELKLLVYVQGAFLFRFLKSKSKCFSKDIKENISIFCSIKKSKWYFKTESSLFCHLLTSDLFPFQFNETTKKEST